MSLTITVRPESAKAGGKQHTLPNEGDNGNQEIDTKPEAEAALAHLPAGAKDVVIVGSKTYTRDQLITIRDAKPATPPAPAPQPPAAQQPAPAGLPVPSPSPSPAPAAPQAGNKYGNGVSHGFGISGYGVAGDLDTYGHGGGGARLNYVAGIPLSVGSALVALDLLFGADVGSFSRGFTAPNGEKVDSSFTKGSVVGGGDVRIHPPVLGNRLFLTAGVRGSVGGFATAPSKSVSLPPSCTPGDFGQQECEPNAGPKVGNAGTQGLINPKAGSARGASGAALGVEVPVAVGARVLEGGWGSVDLKGGAKFVFNALIPNDGHGISYPSVGGFGEVSVRLGGADALAPKAAPAAPPPPAPKPADKDGDGVPDADDLCLDVPGTKENNGCPAYTASVTDASDSAMPGGRFSVSMDVSAKSDVIVQFKDAGGTLTNAGSASVEKGKSGSEFSAPSKLSSGKYKLVVTMKDPATKSEKVEVKDIVIVEKVDASLAGSFAPGQPPTIQNAKVSGLSKLEGVTYTIEGFDKDNKSVGTLNSDKNWTLGDKRGTRIPLASPEKKGFRKEINYVVTLKNKDGHPIWTGSFEVGESAKPKPWKAPKKSGS